MTLTDYTIVVKGVLNSKLELPDSETDAPNLRIRLFQN